MPASSLGSDVRVTPSPTSTQEHPPEFAETLGRVPGVQTATPVVYGLSNALVESETNEDAGNLAAVDPAAYPPCRSPRRRRLRRPVRGRGHGGPAAPADRGPPRGRARRQPRRRHRRHRHGAVRPGHEGAEAGRDEGDRPLRTTPRVPAGRQPARRPPAAAGADPVHRRRLLPRRHHRCAGRHVGRGRRRLCEQDRERPTPCRSTPGRRCWTKTSRASPHSTSGA